VNVYTINVVGTPTENIQQMPNIKHFECGILFTLNWILYKQHRRK